MRTQTTPAGLYGFQVQDSWKQILSFMSWQKENHIHAYQTT